MKIVTIKDAMHNSMDLPDVESCDYLDNGYMIARYVNGTEAIFRIPPGGSVTTINQEQKEN